MADWRAGRAWRSLTSEIGVRCASEFAVIVAGSLATGFAWGGGPIAPPGASAHNDIVFDIPAQDLNAALLVFADRANLQIFYDVDRIKGLRSTVLHGRFAREQALSRLLAGTGLGFRFTGANIISIEKLPTGNGADGIQLDTLRIEGEGLGYVAKSSLSGTKSTAVLIETPQSISVVTRAQMSAQLVQRIPEALAYTSGVVLSNGAYDRFESISA